MRSMEAPHRLKLRIAMDRAAAAGHWQRHAELQKQWMEALLGRSAIDNATGRLDALLERHDARIKQAPGQLGLELAAAAGQGAGEKCGKGWIDPRKTCRIGQEQSGLPVDTGAPFSKATMERLVAGIEQRAYSPPAARHNGTDLALAMQKIAEAPGLTGENARGAMAFMEEARAKVIIAPPRTFAPELEPSAPPSRWSQIASIEENVAQFRRYLQDRSDTAERGRNFAKRMDLWPQELVDAMGADNSLDGRYITKRLDLALNGQPKNHGFAKDLAEFDAAYKDYGAATTKKAREALGGKLQGLHARLMAQSYRTPPSGPDGELEAVRSSMNMALSLPGTMGHYEPRGNTYWKVSMAGLKGAVLHPEEIDPARISSLVGGAMAQPQGAKQFHFSSAKGMKDSEKALITHVHELGHLVHDTSSRGVSLMKIGDKEELTVTFREDSMDVAPPDIQAIHRQGRGPTKYSDSNVAELFAESFVAYVLAPDMLKETHHELYGWVHFALRRARSTAVRSQEATGVHLRW